jgi:inorganic triphosphatase YgiF
MRKRDERTFAHCHEWCRTIVVGEAHSGEREAAARNQLALDVAYAQQTLRAHGTAASTATAQALRAAAQAGAAGSAAADDAEGVRGEQVAKHLARTRLNVAGLRRVS